MISYACRNALQAVYVCACMCVVYRLKSSIIISGTQQNLTIALVLHIDSPYLFTL